MGQERSGEDQVSLSDLKDSAVPGNYLPTSLNIGRSRPLFYRFCSFQNLITNIISILTA